MNSNLTNTIYFIAILFILVCLFYYTKVTKESFFNKPSSEMPRGTIVLLDGKTSDGKGFNIYSNQTTNSCRGKCPKQLLNDDKTCTLNIQDDGNMVIYNSDNYPLWASQEQKRGWRRMPGLKRGGAPYTAYMQDDGNFVLYDRNGSPVWASLNYGGGQGTPPYTLQLLNDTCELVVFDKNWNNKWGSRSDKWRGNPSGPIAFSSQNRINWSQVPGALSCVSLAPNGDLWGTNYEGTIFQKPKSVISLSKIPGNLKMIDTDFNYVCGVANNNIAYCAEYKKALKGDWTAISNNAKWISVSYGRAYLIATDNSLMYTEDLSNLQNVIWHSIPITFKRFLTLSLDANTLVGINDDFELMYADNNLFSMSPNFTKITLIPEIKALINVSLQNNTVMLTDVEGNLWYSPTYRRPKWIKINTNGKAFMATQLI